MGAATGYGRYWGTGKHFEDVDEDLRSDDEREYGTGGLGWEDARGEISYVGVRTGWLGFGG